MFRRISETFTATHLTAILIAAIVTPGAVYAVSTTPVAVTDPLSGHQAAVDVGRRFWVYDPVAGYANSPLNYVRKSDTCNVSGNTFTYTPPAGQTFILKAADFSFYTGVSGADNFVYLQNSTWGFVAGLDSPDVAGSQNIDLGNGFYVRSGRVCIWTAQAMEVGITLQSKDIWFPPPRRRPLNPLRS